MNDFTKEELESLKELVDGATDLFKHKCDEYYLYCNVYDKLTAMIDNYCEHKNQEMDVDGGISIQCKDCGIITLDVM